MSLPKKIKMTQTIHTDRGENTQDIVFSLKEGDDPQVGGFFSWYEPELAESMVATSFPLMRSDTQEEATQLLEQYLEDHSDEFSEVNS